MKTVNNDELSNLVLKGELTQEEALTMTDDKEQLLRLIKNKRWTRYYLRALIYQKHAIQMADLAGKSKQEVAKAIPKLTEATENLKKAVAALAEDWNHMDDEFYFAKRPKLGKVSSYDRLANLNAKKQIDFIDEYGPSKDQWPKEAVKKWNKLNKAQTYLLGELDALKEEYRTNLQKKKELAELREKLSEKELDLHVSAAARFQEAKENYSLAQKLSGYAAIASAFYDLFQMMADAMLA